ncbi:MAG: hypothetical protein ABJA66_03825 [Actinomycetota bacterium]
MTKFIAALILLVFLLFAAQTAKAQTNQWRPVSGARQDNISGMALIDRDGQKTSFIIVNDNKKKEQNHAAIVSVEGRSAPKYMPLRWLGDDVPTDIEAISAIPDVKNQFMALTAAGRVFHIALNRNDNSVKVIKSFDVPQIPQGSDFEGLALQKVNNVWLIAWADRGLDAKPAQLFWSKFDLQTYTFTQIDSVSLKVPYPIGNTRHISDVKIDQTGAVFISSAADPGNDGPFASAVYFAGMFNLSNKPLITFNKSPNLTRLFVFDYHKVEAFEFVPGADGGMAFGTDDENLGAAIFLDW